MEKEAAVRMWSRSIRKNGMRYVRMLSDGDSVAYKAVKDANLYQVDKLECLNHCDKRMGTALRKKAKECKLGGRRHGALTANACSILQSYYRSAITHNLGDAAKMREAVWATFYHCYSTDGHPQYQHCPQGPDSWCFFNKAIANNVHPPTHKDNIRTPLSAQVMKHLGATPSADLQGYQARQNLKRFAQADVDLEPATKRSRKEHKRAAKTSKRGQERQEGQTYGSGMV
ncbi:hypothetical protein ACOMHN_009640 [Nucella lapillus]